MKDNKWVPKFDGSEADPYATIVAQIETDSSGARWQQLLHGEITVQDLDDEEIARGQLRGRNGKFGKPPAVVPRFIFDAMRREIYSRGANLWSRYYLSAIQTCARIMTDWESEPTVRLKAAQEIINRIEGKPLDRASVRVAVNADEQIEIVGKAIMAMLRALGHSPDDPAVREIAFKALNEASGAKPKQIIEGEIVDDA